MELCPAKHRILACLMINGSLANSFFLVFMKIISIVLRIIVGVPKI